MIVIVNHSITIFASCFYCDLFQGKCFKNKMCKYLVSDCYFKYFLMCKYIAIVVYNVLSDASLMNLYLWLIINLELKELTFRSVVSNSVPRSCFQERHFQFLSENYFHTG